MTIKIHMPEEVKQILKAFYQVGYATYIVGGCVRDSLLNRSIHDWDLCTKATPNQMINVCNAFGFRYIPTGIKHGTITILINNQSFEITTFRIDGDYSDNRHPDAVEFTTSLKEDLSRRDFTINSMAYNDDIGLIDPFNGQRDIQNKIIMCVGNPFERFNEDALRMMRAIRFAAQLGFKIENNTSNAILHLSNNINNVSTERIREEFNKILLSDNPIEIYSLDWYGLMKYFLPEYNICKWTSQDNPYHVYSVGKHLICSTQAIEKRLDLKLAMFLHDIAKPKCKTFDEYNIGHFYNHAEKSAEMAFDILKRMKYDNATIDKVTTLIKYHDREIKGKKSIRKLLNEIGEDNFKDLLKVREADIQAQNLKYYGERHNQLLVTQKELDDVLAERQCFSLKDLQINGYDLINMGYKPGKNMGDMLHWILERVIENPELNTKEQLIKLVKEYV